MSPHGPLLPGVLVLGLIAMPLILGGGCGRGSPTSDDTARQISNEELSRMVLSTAQLPPEYPPMEPDEENGVLTLDKAVASVYDPEGLRAQLLESGWESGYQADYKLPDGEKERRGPAFILSKVEAYKTSDGAATKLRARTPTDDASSPRRTLTPSEAARFAAEVHPFEVDLGDEAGGFRDETQVDDGVMFSSAFVTFRRGRIIGQVAISAYNLTAEEAKELEDTAKDLAQTMNAQMSAVLTPPR
jgi:hypothetical protein